MVSIPPPTRPLDTTTSVEEVKGIFSSDILILNALRMGLKDLRANPWKLNLCFASLKDDPYTSQLYGQKELDRAKKWFLDTEVITTLDPNLENATFPRLVVQLMESTEDDKTLADTHYVPMQDVAAEWEPLTEPFSASYDYTTGIVTLQDFLPISLSTYMSLNVGGQEYPILEVLTQTRFRIATGINTPLTGCVIKMSGSRLVATIESSRFREVYRVNCITTGDPVTLLWLYSVTAYVLLSYRKDYLEGRGFEVSSISAKMVLKADMPFAAENAFARSIDITGFVRNSWVSAVSEKVGYTNFDEPVAEDPESGLRISPVDSTPTRWVPEPQDDPPFMAGEGFVIR